MRRYTLLAALNSVQRHWVVSQSGRALTPAYQILILRTVLREERKQLLCGFKCTNAFGCGFLFQKSRIFLEILLLPNPSLREFNQDLTWCIPIVMPLQSPLWPVKARGKQRCSQIICWVSFVHCFQGSVALKQLNQTTSVPSTPTNHEPVSFSWGSSLFSWGGSLFSWVSSSFSWPSPKSKPEAENAVRARTPYILSHTVAWTRVWARHRQIKHLLKINHKKIHFKIGVWLA